MVAERDHVDAGVEQLVGELGGDPDAARDVLPVDDEEVESDLVPERRQQAEQRPFSEAADDIADEQDRAGLLAHWRTRGLRPITAPVWLRWSSAAGCSSCCSRLALLALWALARAVGTLFLVLVIASLVALVLSPLVRFDSRFMPRGLAILFAYLTVIVVVALIAIGLAAPVATQLLHFEHNLPQLTRQANRELADIQRFFDKHGIKIHIEKQGQSALSTLEKDLLKRSGDIVSFSQGLLSKAVSVGIDLILILVLSIYLLVYGPEIGRLVRR